VTVRIDLKQTKTIEEGPVYRVLNQVTYAQNIPPQIFVINMETDVFEHVATVWDLQNYPFTRQEAIDNLIPYYLASECVKDYTDIQTALEFTAHVYARVEWLLRDYEEANDVFEGVLTHTLTG
jgi:hypothetical protein